jgi:hypothetical protein
MRQVYVIIYTISHYHIYKKGIELLMLCFEDCILKI